VLPHPIQLAHGAGGVGGSALRLERRGESPQRPAVPGVVTQVLPIDLFRLPGPPGEQQLRAEKMARGEEPVRGFVVRQPVFGCDRLLEERDRVLAAFLGRGDARRHDRLRHTQHAPQRVESRRCLRRSRHAERL